MKYLARNNHPYCLLPLCLHQSLFFCHLLHFFWVRREEIFTSRTERIVCFSQWYWIIVLLRIFYSFSAVYLSPPPPPLFPLMYSFCSSIVRLCFRLNQVFPGYFALFEWKVYGVHGTASNSVIYSVLFFVTPRFCCASK